MAPKGLKIGDTFEEKDFYGVFRLKVTGFDAQGNYLSQCIGRVDAISEKEKAPVEEEPLEEVSFEDIAAEQETPKPEVKKPAPKKRTPAKRKPATKKK